MWVVVTAAGLVSGVPAASAAQSPSEVEILQLNREAMDAFAELELEEADALLDRARTLAIERGVQGRVLARTRINQGLLALARVENAAALDHFEAALREDPAIELDPLTSTPEAQALFAMAEAQAQRTGHATGSRSTRAIAAGAPSSTSAASTSAATTGTAGAPAASATAGRVNATTDGTSATGELAGSPPDDVALGDRWGGMPRMWARVLHGSLAIGIATSGRRSDETPVAPGSPQDIAFIPGSEPGCRAADDEWCVRVNKQGVLVEPGLRLTIGAWLHPRIGIQLTERNQFDGGETSLARSLVAIQAVALLTTRRPTGVYAQAHLGPGLGQVQLRPAQGGGTRPHIRSGPAAITAGGTIGYRFTKGLGAGFTTEAIVGLPDFGFALDFSLGIEAYFF